MEVLAVILVGVFVLVVVVVLIAACTSISDLREEMMGQFDDLRAAIAQLGVDLGEAVTRVEAKIDSLGEPDPDLTADIAAIREVSSQLDALAADPAPDGGGGTTPTP